MKPPQLMSRWLVALLFGLVGLWSLAHHVQAQEAAPQEATPAAAEASPEVEHRPGGEANLKLPDLSQVKFRGVDGARCSSVAS